MKQLCALLMALVAGVNSFVANAADVANLPEHLYFYTYHPYEFYVADELQKIGENTFYGEFTSSNKTYDYLYQAVRFCTYDASNNVIKFNVGSSGWEKLTGARVERDLYGYGSGSWNDNCLGVPYENDTPTTYAFTVTFTADASGTGVVGNVVAEPIVKYDMSYTIDGGATYKPLTANELMIDTDGGSANFKIRAVSADGCTTKYFGPESGNTTYTSDATIAFGENTNTLTLPAGFYTYKLAIDDIKAPASVTVHRTAQIVYPKTKYIVVNGVQTPYDDGDYDFTPGDEIAFLGDMSDRSGKVAWGLGADATLATGTYTLVKGAIGKFTAPDDAANLVYTLSLTTIGDDQQTWTLVVTSKSNPLAEALARLSPTLPRRMITKRNSYEPQNPLTIWFDTEYSNGAQLNAHSLYDRVFLLGNGRIGLTSSGSRSEKMLINDKTYYDGILDSQHSYAGSDNNTYVPVGYVYSHHTDDPSGSTLSQLDLVDGVETAVSVCGGVTVAREYLVSRKYDVAVVHYTTDTPNGLNYKFSGLDGEGIAQSACTGDTYSYSSKYKSSSVLTSNLCFRVLQNGGSLQSASGEISVSGADEIFLIISTTTDYKMSAGLKGSYLSGEIPEALAARVKANVDAAATVLSSQGGWVSLYNDHVASIRPAMQASTFTLDGIKNDIPSNVLKSKYDGAVGTTSVNATDYTRAIDMIMYQMGRYLAYCSSENEYNTATPNSGLPFYLQGIWAGPSAPWRCDYHTNINFEMNYWPAEVTNIPSIMDNFTTYVTTMANTRWKEYAQKKLTGARGWVCDLGANNFGDIYRYWQGNEYVESNAWLSSHLWQHYLYTLDKNYLRSVFPTMIEAARFYLDYNKTEYGSTQVMIPQSYSPENNGSGTYAAHAHQLVADLIDNVNKAASVLEDDAVVTQYSSDLSALSTLRANMWDGIEIDGNGALEEWKGSAQTVSDHRHLSHLMCLYPLAQVSPMMIATDAQERWNAAYKALTMRSDDDSENALWNRAWKMNCYARARKGDLALRNYAYAFDKTVTSDFRSTCAGRAFQIDGNCGVPAGIAEMLVQSYPGEMAYLAPSGKIYLAPALPSAWPSGQVTGIKAVGNYEVDFTWRDGQITEFTVTALADDPLPFSVHYQMLTDDDYYVKSMTNATRDAANVSLEQWDGEHIWRFTPLAKGASVTVALGEGEDVEPQIVTDIDWAISRNALLIKDSNVVADGSGLGATGEYYVPADEAARFSVPGALAKAKDVRYVVKDASDNVVTSNVTVSADKDEIAIAVNGNVTDTRVLEVTVNDGDQTWTGLFTFHFLPAPTLTLSGSTVTANAASGGDIYYSADGSVPAPVISGNSAGAMSGTRYTSPITAGSTATYQAAEVYNVASDRAYYIKNADGSDSQVTSTMIPIASKPLLVYVETADAYDARQGADVDHIYNVGDHLKVMFGLDDAHHYNPSTGRFNTSDVSLSAPAVTGGIDGRSYAVAPTGSDTRAMTECNGSVGGEGTEDGGLFLTPVSGAFVRLEPARDGVVTLWLDQRGATDATSAVNGIITRRPVYIMDESGSLLPHASVMPTVAAYTGVDATFAATAPLLTLGADFESTWYYAANNWTSLPADTRAAYAVYSTQPALAFSNGHPVYVDRYTQAVAPVYVTRAANSMAADGYEAVSDAQVRYTIQVSAGKTYYVAARNADLAPMAVEFEPTTASASPYTMQQTGSANFGGLSEGDMVDVTLARNFTAGNVHPIVLPFAVSESRMREVFGDDVAVMYLDPLYNSVNGESAGYHSAINPAVDGSKLAFTVHHYQMLYAGVPAYVIPGKSVANPHLGLLTYEGSGIHTYDIGDGYEVTGSYGETQAFDNGEMYFIDNVNGSARLYHSASGIDMKGMRAWIRPKSGHHAPALISVGMTTYGEGEIADGIADVVAEDAVAHRYNDGNVYDMLGRIVGHGSTDGLPAGWYILNGQKLYVR